MTRAQAHRAPPAAPAGLGEQPRAAPSLVRALLPGGLGIQRGFCTGGGGGDGGDGGAGGEGGVGGNGGWGSPSGAAAPGRAPGTSSTGGKGGAGGEAEGGAVYSTGSLDIVDSTFSGDLATSGTGGKGGAGGSNGGSGGLGGAGGWVFPRSRRETVPREEPATAAVREELVGWLEAPTAVPWMRPARSSSWSAP